MGLFNWLFGSVSHQSNSTVNPANGMPMLDGGVDVLGNPFGTDKCSGAGLGADCGWNAFDTCAPAFDSGSSFDHGSHFDYGTGSTSWE